MARFHAILLFLGLSILVSGAQAEPVSYYKQIRPVFQANCQGCHQPAKAKGGYVMTTFERLLEGGRKFVSFRERNRKFGGCEPRVPYSGTRPKSRGSLPPRTGAPARVSFGSTPGSTFCLQDSTDLVPSSRCSRGQSFTQQALLGFHGSASFISKKDRADARGDVGLQAQEQSRGPYDSTERRQMDVGRSCLG